MIPREVFEQTLLGFLKPVRPFLEDDTVNEIMINGPSEIFVERAGRIHRTDARFESRDELMSALRNLAQYVGRPLDLEHPILEARLPPTNSADSRPAPAG